MITVDVHTARRAYSCDATPSCASWIRKGEAYTLQRFSPGEPPYKTHLWTNLHLCQSCMPIPADKLAGAPAPRCSYGPADDECVLPAGHLTDHEFQIGLF